MNARGTTMEPGQLIEQALSAGPLHLTFPRPLEERFEKETAAERCHHLWIFTLIGLLLYDCFVLDDFFVIRDVAGTAVLFRVGFLTPLAVGMIWILRRNPAKFWRESVCACVSVFASAGIVYLSMLSGSPGRADYLYGLIPVVIFSNLLLHLRFCFALASSVAMFLVFCVGAVETSAMTLDVKVNATMLMLTSVMLSMIANHRLERELRRAYLFNLRERDRGLDLSESNRRLEELSNRDGLTGLANRRFLERHLAGTWQRALITGQPLGLLMLDVDFFKPYNDRYGHPAGDDCLRMLAAILRDHMRGEVDLVVRYGGEEFMAVLPGLDLAGCIRIGERIRRAVEAAAMPHGAAKAGAIVTVSVGAASARPAGVGTPAALIADADAALYAAKQGGRNRVWPPPAFAERPVAGGAV